MSVRIPWTNSRTLVQTTSFKPSESITATSDFHCTGSIVTRTTFTIRNMVKERKYKLSVYHMIANSDKISVSMLASHTKHSYHTSLVSALNKASLISKALNLSFNKQNEYIHSIPAHIKLLRKVDIWLLLGMWLVLLGLYMLDSSTFERLIVALITLTISTVIILVLRHNNE